VMPREEIRRLTYRGSEERVATVRVLCREVFQGRDVANPRHKEHAVATRLSLPESSTPG
jgi:hypothetical protein